MINNIRIWGIDGIDEGTIRQAERVARLPILAGPVVLLPDAHIGTGATIGTVIITENAIVASITGVDIGCGIIVSKTDLTASQLPDDMQPLVSQFERSIPAGVGRSRNIDSQGKSDRYIMDCASKWLRDNPHPLEDKLQKIVLPQLGTLGSGNHFVEVCLNEGDEVFVMLHSGSRGVGNQLAQKHINIARQQKLDIEDRDLSWFVGGTPEFDAYISDMLWCQAYALENRQLMMWAATNDLFQFVGHGRVTQTIQCHHNFAVKEHHGGKEVWVTRKGAIRAEKGDMGIIPGSMGTKSYIVEGLGNADSYNSAPHGAGRRLSRGQAKREFTVDSLKEMMGSRAWNKNQPLALLDEHPQAYKDIEGVIESSKDLVRPIHTLRSIVNYKGV